MAYQNNRSGNYGSDRRNNRSYSAKTEPANVFAPYNFVPFPQSPAYIKDENTIVSHDVLAEKADDGEELFTGEIHYSLESMTPIFIDDGTKQHRFCRDAAGNCIIPGSTMRGLIRNNAMVLGLGNVRDEIDDYSLMYRNVANGLNKKRYGIILGADVARIKNNSGKEFTLSVLKNVRAGYIEKTESGEYIIYKTELDPADEAGYAIDPNLGRMNYYTLSERIVIEQYLRKKEYKADPDTFPYSFLIPEMQERMMNQIKPFFEDYDRRGNISYKGSNNPGYMPYYLPVAYKLNGSRNVSSLKPLESANGTGYKRGVLVSTGFMQKKKVVYVIPDIDHSSGDGNPRIAVRLSERDVRDFKVDYNRRKNSITLEKKNPNRINSRKVEEYKAFFNLPVIAGEAGRKPVFYIEYGGRCYFGFTPRLRLFYDNTVADGINKNHVQGKTDYVKAIFGYTSTNTAKAVKDTADARKTRVSFSDAVQTDNKKALSTRYLTLSEPRPTDCLNYLDQSSGETSYNSNQMQLRGAKQYWLHRNADPGLESVSPNDKLNSMLNPLDTGSRFEGVIRFKNLRKYELGLLLWSVRLEENSWMNVGKGKAYGYGAVKLTILSARSLDYRKAYGLPSEKDEKGAIVSAIFEDPYNDLIVDDLIESYKTDVRKYNGNRDIMTLPLIRDFLAMKDSSKIPAADATKYMTLEQFQDQTRSKTPLPIPLEVIKKNQEEKVGNAVVFLAGYNLSDSQKKKLEEMAGLPVIQVKQWPDDRNIETLSREYKSIALPSNVDNKKIESSKRQYEHVYKAVKTDKFDNDWICLK